MNKKHLQHVPLKPTGCFLDYTYCSSENCKNECGRKMSPEIDAIIRKVPYSRVAYANFCDDEENE